MRGRGEHTHAAHSVGVILKSQLYVCENAHGLFEKTSLYSCLLNVKFLRSLRKMTFYKQLLVTTISDSLISPITLITLTAWNLANTVLSNLPQAIKCRTLKPFLIKNFACRSLILKIPKKKHIEKRQSTSNERWLQLFDYHNFIAIKRAQESGLPGSIC